MLNVEILGFIAGSLSAGAFMPQAVKTFRTRQTGDLSTVMLIIQVICVSLWMVYGIFKHSPSLIVCNFLTFLVVLSVLVMKLRYGRRKT